MHDRFGLPIRSTAASSITPSAINHHAAPTLASEAKCRLRFKFPHCLWTNASIARASGGTSLDLVKRAFRAHCISQHFRQTKLPLSKMIVFKKVYCTEKGAGKNGLKLL